MKDRYPRTVADYVETARLVIVECEGCRHKAPVDLSVLLLTFGADFDMYASMRVMRDRLTCSECGAPRPFVSFYDPHVRGSEVSFDESVDLSLEFSAYDRARAAS